MTAPMRPVFIGGSGRSGTTMLGSMLGAHPAYVAVPESQFKTAVLAAADPSGTVDVARAVEQIRADGRFRRLWGLDIAGLEERLGPRAPARTVIEGVVRAWGAANGKLEPEVWIDQSPSNVRFARTLADAFPDARFVHLVRDGRAVAASILKMDWGPTTPAAAARFWLVNLAFGLALESAHGLAEVTTRAHYERVVAEPEAALRELCAFLELAYEPAMSERGGLLPSSYTASIHAHVGGPPRPDRIEAWREELSPRDVEIFESVARDALSLLGYQPEYGLAARGLGRREALAAGIRTAAGRRLNRLRRLRRQLAVR